MAQTVEVRVGEVEVLVEVVPSAGSQQTSARDRAERAADYVAGAFDRAQAAIEEIAVSTARTVGRITRRVGSPELVEVEFGVKVSVKGDVVVAGSAAEASLKVKIVYGADARRASQEQQVEVDAAPEGEPAS